MQRRGVKHRGFQSDVATLYTRGGIKYDKTDITQSVKGWSDEGIKRFNALFDKVKQDRKEFPQFERDWLEQRQNALAEAGATPKQSKRQPTHARSELFESEDENDVALPATKEPVEDSESETDDET